MTTTHTETVTLPKGLWNSVQRTLTTMPIGAFAPQAEALEFARFVISVSEATAETVQAAPETAPDDEVTDGGTDA